jgi:sensor histidine kinase regulating citrate/malate metabolism
MFGLTRIKTYFRHASIQTKLTFAIGSSAILALLIVASILFFREYINRSQQTEQDLSAIAGIVAWNNRAALASKDLDSTKESLQSLKNQQGIVSAFLYDGAGKIVATYKTARQVNESITATQAISIVRDNTSTTLTEPLDNSLPGPLKSWLGKIFSDTSRRPLQAGYSEVSVYDQHHHLHVFRPIFMGNKLIGTLQLVDDLSRLNAFLSSFYLITGSLVLLTLLAVWYISTRLQRIFTDPMLNLMQAKKKISPPMSPKPTTMNLGS